MRHEEELGIYLKNKFFTVLRIKVLWYKLNYSNEALINRDTWQELVFIPFNC